MCTKCSKDINNIRQSLTCSLCDGVYHLDCGNVSSPRFRLMTPNKRKKWICDRCWSTTKTKNSAASTSESRAKNYSDTPSNDNVTKRSKYVINVSTENSYEELTEIELGCQTVENISLNRSCPEKLQSCLDLEEMKDKINSLQNELQTAENEIDNLLAENYSLKNVIKKQSMTINQLSIISRPSSASSTTNKKCRKNLKTTRLDFSAAEDSPRQQKHQSSTPTLNNNVNQTPPDHTPTSNTSVSENTVSNEDIQNTKTINVNNKNNDNIKKIPKNNIKNVQNKKARLYIFSDDQGRGIQRQLQRELGERYNIFSMLKPGATTEKLLECSGSLCSDLNKSDYVLILTGKHDVNPMKLSSFLYYYLYNLQHTNVILCENLANMHLNVNYLFRFYKSLLPHVHYIDLNYTFLGRPKNTAKHISQNVLREILRSEYLYKVKNYNLLTKNVDNDYYNNAESNVHKTFASKGIQTGSDLDRSFRS